ncbi:hypothetical protein KCP77_14735 [Salmonella enterica subsp. enterica]|nr:hypothetical protein KCP77_14735 [Salmonella enterica subsp. enterica]
MSKTSGRISLILYCGRWAEILLICTHIPAHDFTQHTRRSGENRLLCSGSSLSVCQSDEIVAQQRISGGIQTENSFTRCR